MPTGDQYPVVTQGTAAANSSPWPVKNINAGKAMYSAGTSGGVTQVVTVNTIQSIAYLWHPASIALRYQLNRIIIALPIGSANAGIICLQLRRITAENGTPGGTAVSGTAFDLADANSGATFRYNAAAPTREAKVAAEYSINMASTWDGVLTLDFCNLLEGKPPILRASTAEGWELSMLVYTAVTTAQRIGVTMVWTEE